MNKFFITTTIPDSLNFFSGFLSELNKYFDVTALSSDYEKLNKISDVEGIKCKCIPMKRNISIKDDFISLVQMVRYFYIEKPLIVHGNTPKASLLTMLAGWINKIPIRIYMCHGLKYQGAHGFLRIVLMIMEWITCFCATDVICVSNGVKEELIKNILISKRKFKVIGYGSPSGVDFNHYSKSKYEISLLRRQLNINDDDFVYIFVGRIVKDKGIEELINAFSEVRSESKKLLIVGNFEQDLDPIPERTLNIIKRDKNIKLLGYQKDIRPFLAVSDILVLPSYREGLGMVLIEAAAMEIPSICSNIIGPNEVVIDRKTGYLTKPKDYKHLSELMNECIRDSENLKKMGSYARVVAKEKFDREKVWEQYIDEYKKMEIAVIRNK